MIIINHKKDFPQFWGTFEHTKQPPAHMPEIDHRETVHTV